METEVFWVKQLRLSANGVPPPAIVIHLDSAVVILGCCYDKKCTCGALFNPLLTRPVSHFFLLIITYPK